MNTMNIDQFIGENNSIDNAIDSTKPKKIKPIPKVINGRYKIKRVLGVGGMGMVYQVDDLLLHGLGIDACEFAIKVLNSEASAYHDAELILVNEYLQANQLHHPNIVPISHLALCNESQRGFLVMPMIKGDLLSLLLESPFESIPDNDRLKYAYVLINCLIHCHKRGVIHGDIKPSNVLISNNNEVHLFDFSISRNVNSEHNKFAIDFKNVHAWSGDYAAPEVLQGNAPTIKSDLYSLAILLYKLLLKTHPYQQKKDISTHRTKEEQQLHLLLLQAMRVVPSERQMNMKALLSIIKSIKTQQSKTNDISALKRVTSIFTKR